MFTRLDENNICTVQIYMTPPVGARVEDDIDL